jgi:hypothetical protein
MKQAFRIELLDQGWLTLSDADADLCSHGHLRPVIGGQEVVGGTESYGISESALAMLRTLAAEHTKGAPVAQRMVFHGCGTILMMGCPIGADFSVHHSGRLVTIGNAVRYDTTNESQATRFPNLQVELPEVEYRAQIIGFELRARQLFTGTASAPQTISTLSSTAVSGRSSTQSWGTMDTQSNRRFQPTARASSCERSAERMRRG